VKVTILDTYYPAFLDGFYSRNQGLAEAGYQEQCAALMGMCFGTSDYYSSNLRMLGHEADDFVVNCEPLQRAWLHANAPNATLPPGKAGAKAWQMAVFREQVKQSNPDVVYVQDLTYFDAPFLDSLREFAPLVCGQTAYALDWGFNFSVFDRIFTSFPHYVERFNSLGVPSSYLRIAFEPRILERLGEVRRDLNAVFVGGLVSPIYPSTMPALEAAALDGRVEFWGYGSEFLKRESAIRAHYHGEAWGLDAYRILARSRVALNRHGDVAEGYSNNMRLYEATGVGSCLVTDSRIDLDRFFDVGKEVVAYNGAADCVEKINYLLDHEEERAAIAAAGQRRTLEEHTYHHRMQELAESLEATLTSARSRSGPRRGSMDYKPAQAPLSQRAKNFIRRSPAGPLAVWILKNARTRAGAAAPVSGNYHLIDKAQVDEALAAGWQEAAIPAKQRELVDQELRRMYQGDVIPVYRVAAEAVMQTGCEDPFIVEIGCASGYYHEVLSHLLDKPVRYLGLDYSVALIEQGRSIYPDLDLMVADATDLPLPDSHCDILFSAALLMHVPEYEKALGESVRVSRQWCIFHRTPVTASGDTRYMTKDAYGVPVVELVFGEQELADLFQRVGLEVVRTIRIDRQIIPGFDHGVEMMTYVCRKNT
jgi:spore maturation protein CgeB